MKNYDSFMFNVQVPSLQNPRSSSSQAERVAAEVEAKRIEMPTQVEKNPETIEVDEGSWSTWGPPIFVGIFHKQQMLKKGIFFE